MKDKDEHFWIEDVINRIPSELVPDKRDWSSVLTALTKLKTERNNAVVERNELAAQVERLRGVIEHCVSAVEDTHYGWEGDCGVINKVNVIADSVLDETPSQSLEAVKREWKAAQMDKAVEMANDNLSGWLAIAIDDLERI